MTARMKFIEFGPAPFVPLGAFSAPREVCWLPSPYFLTTDIHEAERRGWLTGLDETWQITDAGWMARERIAARRAR